MIDPITYPTIFQKEINAENKTYPVEDYQPISGTPAITFITRHMRLRPKCIQKNIASVRKQTCQNYQQIFLIDENTQ